VYVIGFGQASFSVADYKPQMEEWLQDRPFWTEFRKYVRFFAQEVYGDVRRWGVADASRNERTRNLDDFLMHPLNLARAAPEGAAVAREYLEESYVALANAAWPWDDSGFGNTKVSIDEMRRYVSEQLYATREFVPTNPHGAPAGRVGYAYAPFNTCSGKPCIDPTVYAGLSGLLLDRLASGLHHAYDEGGSPPPGACGPADHVWCDASVDGASFTDLWDLFNVWGAVR